MNTTVNRDTAWLYWKVLAKLYPKTATEIKQQVQPTLEDHTLIRDIYGTFLRKYAHIEDRNILFSAIILYLYNPATLITPKVYAANRVNTQLSICFGKSDVRTSQIISQAKSYMKIPSFRKRVEKISKEVSNS